jgi:hypothetical protein
MSEPVELWWGLLRSIAVLNVSLWLLCAIALRRRPAGRAADVFLLQRLQLLLAAGYVLGCAWRSFFPVFDVPRQVLLDAWPSSALLGRSVATFAEFCFAAQWALLLQALAKQVDCSPAGALARCLLPLILLAELCSWHAVLSTSNLGHAIEESLWALSATLLALGLLLVRARLAASQALQRRWLGAGVLLLAAYVLYMLCVDVPMYASRWQEELANGHLPLDLLQGFSDAATRRVPSTQWADWRGEAAWMTAYFSAGVWISIALALLPPRLAISPAARSALKSGPRPGKARSHAGYPAAGRRPS